MKTFDDLEKNGYLFLFWTHYMDQYYVHFLKNENYFIAVGQYMDNLDTLHSRDDDIVMMCNLNHAIREKLPMGFNKELFGIR